EAPPLTLTALQHVPLLRELSVDTSGRTRDFTVLLELEHPAAAELTVTLTAPSGVQAALPLGTLPDVPGRYAFSAGTAPSLAALAGEERQGVWRLTIVDREPGAAGRLLGWALVFAPD